MTKQDTRLHVTIGMVAQQAGVAKSTVSRVLNNRGRVAAATKVLVLEAVERLNYNPDPVARELSFGHTALVGLNDAYGNRRLVPYVMLFRNHFAAALASSGFRVVEVPSKTNGLPEQLPDAMVLAGVYDDDPRLEYLRRADVPFVVVGKAEGERWVCPDDFDGGRQAAEHLLKLGHQNMLLLMGDDRNFSPSYPKHGDAERARGFRKAVESSQTETRITVARCDFTSLGAFLAVRRAFETDTFTAIFALTDEMAVGAVRAAEDSGRHVPGDISVVGFDDLPEIGETLTTVRQDVRKVALVAVELLSEALRGEHARSVQLPVQLVVRGTTARR